MPLPGEELPAPPPELARRFPSGAHPIERQHRTALYDAPTDVVVLSIQSVTSNALVRHRRDGWLMLPDALETWEPAPRALLAQECVNAGLVPLDEAMRRLERLIPAIEAQTGAHVLVYNLSPVIPGERTHCWLGAEDSLALRARRFNLAVAELSGRLGFSVVDVERIVACAGADRLKVDLFHLTAEGWRLVAEEEVARILEERGCFDTEGAP